MALAARLRRELKVEYGFAWFLWVCFNGVGCTLLNREHTTCMALSWSGEWEVLWFSWVCFEVVGCILMGMEYPTCMAFSWSGD